MSQRPDAVDKALLQEVKARLGAPLDHGWVLDKILGIGASASVYRAHKDAAGGPIAIKVMHTKHQRSHVISQRFIREQHILATIEHPHTLRTFGPPQQGPRGELYMMMELLEGSSLSQLMHKRGRVPMDAARVAELMAPVLEVLQMCHDKQIFHRDIKPANLFLTHDGVMKVLDFGLAKIQDDGQRLTRAGAALGTPSFMSPEQAGSDVRKIDGRSDIFAVGAIMHFLLCGQYVHEGSSPKETHFIAATTPAPSLRDRAKDLPRAVIDVVDKALAWEITDRWQTADQMRQALEALHPLLLPTPSLPPTLPPPLAHPAYPDPLPLLRALREATTTSTDESRHALLQAFAPYQVVRLEVSPHALSMAQSSPMPWPWDPQGSLPLRLWTRGVRHLTLSPPLTRDPQALAHFLRALAQPDVSHALWRADLTGCAQEEVAGSVGVATAYPHLADLYARRRQPFSESIAGEHALAPPPSPYVADATMPFEAQTSQREFQSLRRHLMRVIKAHTATTQARASRLPPPSQKAALPPLPPPNIQALGQLVCHLLLALAHPAEQAEHLRALHAVAAACHMACVHVLICAGSVMCQGVRVPSEELIALATHHPSVATLLDALRHQGADEVALRLPLSPSDILAISQWLEGGTRLSDTRQRRLTDQVTLCPGARSAQAQEKASLSRGLDVYMAHTLSLCAAMCDQLRDPNLAPELALATCSHLAHTFARAGLKRPSLCLGALALEPEDGAVETLWAMATITLCAHHLEVGRAQLVSWLMATLLVSMGQGSDAGQVGWWVELAHQLALPHDASLPVLTYEGLHAHQSAHTHTPSLLGPQTPPDVRALLVSMAVGFARARARGDEDGRVSHTDAALNVIQNTWCHDKVDRMLFALITRTLGLGPRGSVVHTAAGWQGVVVANSDSPRSFAKPLVRLVYTPQGRLIQPVQEHNLAHQQAAIFGEAVTIEYKVKEAHLLQVQERVLASPSDPTLQSLPAISSAPEVPKTGNFGRRRAKSWLDGDEAVVRDQAIEQLNQEASLHTSPASGPMGQVKMEDILHLVPLELLSGPQDPRHVNDLTHDLTTSWHDLLQEVELEGLLSLHDISEVTSPVPLTKLSELTDLDQAITPAQKDEP